MFTPIGFYAGTASGGAPTGTFTLTPHIGATLLTPTPYLTGSTNYLGSYGIGNPFDTSWGLCLDITSSNITGTVSSIAVTLPSAVPSSLAPPSNIPIRVFGFTGAERGTGVNTLLATINYIAIVGGQITFTLTGTNLQNWFNGTTYNGITLDANAGYYAYWWGFNGATFVLS